MDLLNVIKTEKKAILSNRLYNNDRLIVISKIESVLYIYAYTNGM